MLRESGFAIVRTDGARRLYAVQPEALEVDVWLERFRRFWSQHLDALATELARGKRERRTGQTSGSAADSAPDTSGKDQEPR